MKRKESTGVRILLLCMGLCLTTLVQAQLFSEYNFKFKSYTVKDGLPHDKVNKVAQDSKGFLWMITEGGLARFDGYAFRNFKHSATDTSSLPHDNLVDIAIDSEDRLWLAFDHGFCSYDPNTGKFRDYLWKGKSLACQKLAFDKENQRIYIASRKDGLFYVDVKKLTLQETTLSNYFPHNITSLVVDSKETLWITIERHGFYKVNTRSNKAAYFPSEEWLMFITEDTFRNQYLTGRWLGEFMPFDGVKLPAMENRYVIARFEGYEKCTYTDSDIAPQLTGKDIIWVTSHRGLGLFDINRKKIIKHHFFNPQVLDGIGSNWLTDIFISKDGSVWISSWNGVHAVNPQAQSFSKFYLKELDINLYNLISGIADDPFDKNKIWMSVNGTGLVEWDKKEAKIKRYYFKEFLYPRDNNYEKRWIHHLYHGKNNVLWMGTYGGFVKVKEGVVSHVDTWVDGNATYANDSYQDKSGKLWLMGRHLIEFNPETEAYRAYTLRKEDGYDRFRDNFHTLAEGKDPYLWVGTSIGLYRFHKQQHRFEKLQLKYHNTDERALNDIRSLYVLGDNLYIGTTVGLYVYQFSSRKLYKRVDGFFEIKSLASDTQGNLWAFSNNGLYKLNAHENTIQRFDQNDGIYTLSSDPITFFWYQDQMHIGHRSAFTSFDPLKLGQNNNVPIPYITEVNALGKEWTTAAASRLVLPYNQTDLSIHYTALEYAAPSKLSFSTYLRGYDKGWSAFSMSRVKDYTNLSPGTYEFWVRAKNINGIVSLQKAGLTFVVKPAYWQTFWFRTLALLALALALSLLYYYRVSVIRKRANEKMEINQKMAELDEKLLRSQMNPHFIFNSLNSIQKYIWESKEELAAEYLASFAKLMRGILENSRKEYVLLEEEFKILKLYIELEHRRSNGKFEYQISLDPKIDADKVKILPLILQPFIENAIWHGLGKKEENGFLKVDFTLVDQQNYKVTIEDNGVGRNFNQNSAPGYQSLGQSITNQRLQKLMESTRKNADVSIFDLFDDSGKAAGTRVVVHLPIIY